MSYQKETYDQYGNPIPTAQYVAPQHVQYEYSQQQHHGHHADQAVRVQAIKPQETPPTGWRDLPFAILFYLNVIAIAVLMVVFGFSTLKGEGTDGNSENSFFTGSEAKYVAAVALGLSGIAAVISLLMIKLIVRFASVMIKSALWFSVGMAFAVAIVGFLTGNVVLGVIGLIFGLISLCYARAVQNRIPFATANLKVAAEAVKTHQTMYCIALVVLIVQVGWIFMWSLAFLGITEQLSSDNEQSSSLSANGEVCISNVDCRSGTCTASSSTSTTRTCAAQSLAQSSYAAYFFMLVSFYWGIAVIKNISHVTVAGTVATWWFHAESKGATSGAFKRSVTTSFGSICLGSLIVAILKTLRTIAQQAQNQGESCACLAVCILQCIENLIEYFNKWAFTYVGVYGYKFTTAAKAVISLFKQRGFDAIINDDLIGNVLGLAALSVGLICAGIGVAFHFATDVFTFDNAAVILGILGFFIGVGITIIPLSVIESAVTTIFVCFAEDPASFAQHHNELYQPLVQAWYDLYPDVMVSSGYYYA